MFRGFVGGNCKKVTDAGGSGAADRGIVAEAV